MDTLTETACRERWATLVQYAAARGVSEDHLRQLVLRPTHRGGCGWAWWRPEKTTPELADWLRWRVDEMAKDKPFSEEQP